jgi:hypothetical protein
MKIQPISLHAGADTNASGTANRLLSGLKPGAQLDVEVVRQEKDGELTIRIGGLAVRARSSVMLEPGQTVRVRVMSSWPDLLMKLIASSTTEGKDLQRLLLKGLPLMEPETLRALWVDIAGECRWLSGANARGQDWMALLQSYVLQAGKIDLPSYLQRCGLLLEAKIARWVLSRGRRRAPLPDLKALILRMMQGSNRPLQATGRLYDLLQGAQSMSLVSREDETQLYLPLMLWGWQRGEWGDLTVFRDGGRSGKRRGWWVRLRLELGDLGRLSVEILLQANLLHCRFRTSDARTQRAIEKALPVLQSSLADMNAWAVRCDCRPLEDEGGEWDGCPANVPEGLFQTMA